MRENEAKISYARARRAARHERIPWLFFVSLLVLAIGFPLGIVLRGFHPDAANVTLVAVGVVGGLTLAWVRSNVRGDGRGQPTSDERDPRSRVS